MTRPNFLNKALVALALLAIVGTAYAASSTEPTAQNVIDEVKALAAKARQQRGADPWLLQQMDSLVARYDRPWGAPVIDETFRDGEISRNPSWNVVSGKFWLDSSLGLRSQSQARPPATESSADNQGFSWGNVLMGMLITGMTQGSPQAPQASQSQTQPAVITVPVSVSNAFALDVAFSQHRPPGEPSRIEFGMLDGSKGSRGYTLILRTGNESFATLKRVEPGRDAVLQRVPMAGFSTGAVQNVSWRRGSDGAMIVTLNNKTLINVVDRGAGEKYQRMGIINRGGDYAVRRVTLAGART